jgi:hypothetical protein
MVNIKLPASDSIVPYVLLANLPQIIISGVYLTYNAIFTSMLTGREWARYAVKRASLRVTLSRPGQRSTYFLQLPYTWSIPLLIGSIMLHLFISQSIFLARIIVYRDGVPMPNSNKLSDLSLYHQSGNVFTSVGYSDNAIIVSICWGTALVLFALLVANICTYPKGLPLGGTNSAVISAACHLRYGDDDGERVEEDIAARRLMWGVTVPGGMDRTGHCSFTDKDVESPHIGFLYAGIVR